MADENKLTPAQTVLSTCELIGMILNSLNEIYAIDAFGERCKNNPPSWYSMLAKYGRINSYWFNEAMRLLWPDGTAIKHRSIVLLLAKAIPSRRQYYASFIKSSCLIDVCKDNIRKNNKILCGIVFPKLQYLALIIQQRYRQKLWIPKICAPILEALHVRLASLMWSNGDTEVSVTFVQRRWRGTTLHLNVVMGLIHRIQVCCTFCLVRKRSNLPD
ncbi:hypothetical protein N7520_004123 [Penicillium odoratum]|uniref:uncharacterized protein n=1 Tax=Penicillium odoratum TaxID=1167516 RepID=UPI0025498017|nr:uncharacterized protein N7520_004123 [Penicillium odoratum]KAJ5769564.1 hypothetical protein N7520_004123 [Penicillium odoratum]